MQMFAFKNTEAGIRRLQQARMPVIALPEPDPMQPLLDEIAALKTRIADLEAKPSAPAEIIYLPRLTTFQRIEERACKLFGLTLSELRSNRRHQEVVFARQFVFYWAARLTQLSFPQIGKQMRRDHTTILAGKRAYIEKRAKMGRHLRAVR